VIGFHSVIDNPDSVSRVIPPTTTIAKTKAATPISQLIKTAGRAACVSEAECELGAVSICIDMALNADCRKQRRLQKLITKLHFNDVML
jgi:hypothetical protein